MRGLVQAVRRRLTWQAAPARGGGRRQDCKVPADTYNAAFELLQHCCVCRPARCGRNGGAARHRHPGSPSSIRRFCISCSPPRSRGWAASSGRRCCR
ncbi:protein of unknown function [Cupriavidus neocaledonicus]|uniref:Uncharacterized protein n=1 Tax=Cupriavidus neocaledonicus TaxID=1040979 RepID=A0A375H792_9BURK|nr:conserved hypothetical protein [Cupriavidus neocaledonicus]SPD47592.1 protein of unknown function [Cupriavidus neocaledonicus]